MIFKYTTRVITPKILFKLFTLSALLFLLSACGENNSDAFNDDSFKLKCDISIDKDYYEICYDYGFKGALSVSYTLDGSLVNNPNITDRPSFYEETRIPKQYRSNSDDYRGSGYDRGHLANDASFDYSQSSLESVYSMANITPQDPDVNRYSWIDTEKLEREKAVLYDKVQVTILVKYSDNPQRIGKDEIAVPSGFMKEISNQEYGYKECFYYENIPYDVASDSIQEHKIACDTFEL